MRKPIASKEDWWNLVDSTWDDLREIVFHHISPWAPAHEAPGDAASPRTGRIVEDELEHLRATRDKRLHCYLNVSWCMASDSYAWSVANWGAFCDLCSESWVFQEASDEN